MDAPVDANNDTAIKVLNTKLSFKTSINHSDNIPPSFALN